MHMMNKEEPHNTSASFEMNVYWIPLLRPTFSRMHRLSYAPLHPEVSMTELIARKYEVHEHRVWNVTKQWQELWKTKLECIQNWHFNTKTVNTAHWFLLSSGYARLNNAICVFQLVCIRHTDGSGTVNNIHRRADMLAIKIRVSVIPWVLQHLKRPQKDQTRVKKII